MSRYTQEPGTSLPVPAFHGDTGHRIAAKMEAPPSPDVAPSAPTVSHCDNGDDAKSLFSATTRGCQGSQGKTGWTGRAVRH